MYLTLAEFEQRFAVLSSIVGGEHKRSLASRALEQAHAALNAELNRRYEAPIDINAVPAATAELLKRWVFYLAVRELLGLQGMVISREQQPILTDLVEMVDAQITAFVSGPAVLAGVPARTRVRIGYGTLPDSTGG